MNSRLIILSLAVMVLVSIVSADTTLTEVVGTFSTTGSVTPQGGVCFYINSSIAYNVSITGAARTSSCTATKIYLYTNCTINSNPWNCIHQANTTNLTGNQFTFSSPIKLNTSTLYCLVADNAGSTYTRAYSDLGARVVRASLNYTDSFYNGGWSGNYYFMNIYSIDIVISDGLARNLTVVSTSPANNTLTNQTTPVFRFNASGTEPSYNCSLNVNGSWYGTNSSVVNATNASILTNASLPDGNLSWYVVCSNTTLTNTSATNYIKISTYPNKPTLNAPAEASLGQLSPVTLNISVTDNQSYNQNVSFYDYETGLQIGTTQTNKATGSAVTQAWTVYNGAVKQWYVTTYNGRYYVNSSVFTFSADPCQNRPLNKTYTVSGIQGMTYNQSDLTVKLLLNSTNFDFDTANATGKDIAFKNSTNGGLYHWIEDWNLTNESAVVWVKLPSMNNSQTRNFTMCYGNNSFNDSSDSTNAFRTGNITIPLSIYQYVVWIMTGNKTVYSAGENGYYQLGVGNTTELHTLTLASALGSDVCGIAVGTYEGHIIDCSDRLVYGIGRGTYGMRGDNSTATSATLTATLLNGKAKQLSVGGYGGCAIIENSTSASGDTPKCWGHCDSGQCGNGDYADYILPQAVNISNVSTINMGCADSAAIHRNGTLFAWGWNGHGEVGMNTTKYGVYSATNHTNSTATPIIPYGVGSAYQVVGGGDSIGVVLANGSAMGSGWNIFGAVGDNTSGWDHLVFNNTLVVDDIVQSARGQWGVIYMTSNKSVWYNGNNNVSTWTAGGSAGDGTNTNKLVPIQMNVPCTPVYVDAGIDSAWIVCENGIIYTTGGNTKGELGIGSTANISTFTATTVQPMAGVRFDMTGGVYHKYNPDHDVMFLNTYTSSDPVITEVSSTTSPQFTISLASPANRTLTSNSTPTFQFNVSGTNSSYNCNLLLNGTIETITMSNSSYWCYQGQANVSTACGGVGNGTINLNYADAYSRGLNYSAIQVYDNVSNILDDNFSTSAEVIYNGIYGIIDMNFTVPQNQSNINQSQVAIRIGSMSAPQNYSIPSACWDNHTLQFEVSGYLIYDATDDYSAASCWNGTQWQLITIDNTNIKLWGLAMNWRMDPIVATNASITSISPSVAKSEGTYTWQINCTSGNVSNVSETRTIYIDSAAPAFHDVGVYRVDKGEWSSSYCGVNTATYSVGVNSISKQINITSTSSDHYVIVKYISNSNTLTVDLNGNNLGTISSSSGSGCNSNTWATAVFFTGDHLDMINTVTITPSGTDNNYVAYIGIADNTNSTFAGNNWAYATFLNISDTSLSAAANNGTAITALASASVLGVGQPEYNYIDIWSSGTTTGTRLFNYTANDTYGLNTTYQFSFPIDATAPTFSTIGGNATLVIHANETQTTATYNVSITETNLSTKHGYFDGTEYNITGTQTNYSIAPTMTAYGTYLVNFTATDVAGNTNSTSKVVSVAKVNYTINQSTPPAYNPIQIPFNASDSENAEWNHSQYFIYNINASVWANSTFNETFGKTFEIANLTNASVYRYYNATNKTLLNSSLAGSSLTWNATLNGSEYNETTWGYEINASAAKIGIYWQNDGTSPTKRYFRITAPNAFNDTLVAEITMIMPSVFDVTTHHSEVLQCSSPSTSRYSCGGYWVRAVAGTGSNNQNITFNLTFSGNTTYLFALDAATGPQNDSSTWVVYSPPVQPMGGGSPPPVTQVLEAKKSAPLPSIQGLFLQPIAGINILTPFTVILGLALLVFLSRASRKSKNPLGLSGR